MALATEQSLQHRISPESRRPSGEYRGLTWKRDVATIGKHPAGIRIAVGRPTAKKGGRREEKMARSDFSRLPGGRTA
jgi:hypothetical protein